MKYETSNHLLIVLVYLVALAPLQATASESELSINTPPETVFLEGITYTVVNGVELKLNIALPAGSVKAHKRYPLLIFIHGGGWKTGHRNAYNGRIRNSAERGYVAATISHRLTADEDEKGHTLYPWPAAIHDCKAAVRFLKTHARQYHLDPEKIGVTGASSGGHLALLLGLTDESAGLEGGIEMPIHDGLNLKPLTDTSVHAVFNKSGPTDLVACYDAPIVKPFLEDFLGKPNDVPKSYHEASPVVYLSENAPPIMTIHGELDHVVPVEQARLLHKRMNDAGLSHEYLELQGEKHVFTRPAGKRYWQAFYEFFDEHLKNP